MDLQLGTRRRGARTVSLTALIDVVFILLLFFMLTARLSSPAGIAVSLGEPAVRNDVPGPPSAVAGDRPDQLVIGPTGLWLNDQATDWDTLATTAAPAGQGSRGPLVLTPLANTPLQTVLDTRDRLVALGWPAAALTMQLTRPGTRQ
jgi:biopolymer transport protein ExbD